MTKKIAPETGDIRESEDELIRTAELAVSQCRWTVGECASKWTKRYAKGRTDADFAALIGLSGDQVFQRRRVWESFSDVYLQFESLKWSHFYAALTWDDAAECLQWAQETESTVAEMKAWRRAMRGEDLSSDPADEPEYGEHGYLAVEPAMVQDPRSGSGKRNPAEAGRGEGRGAASSEESAATLTGVARGLNSDEDYAPFRQGAMQPPAQGKGSATAAPPKMTAEQLAKRLCSTLERCAKALTPETLREFQEVPDALRQKLLRAADALHAAIAELR